MTASMVEDEKKYCALGFGDNFFYALGEEAIPIPNQLLVENDDSDEKYSTTAKTPSYTTVSLMPIHSIDESANAVKTTSNTTMTENHAALYSTKYSLHDDSNASASTAESWLRNQLYSQSNSTVSGSSSSSVSSPCNTKFVSDNLPVISCGATHTSMILPGVSPSSVSASTTKTKGSTVPIPKGSIPGDAYVVGTIFGHAHHRLTIQPSRLPLRIVRISSGRRHILALTEGAAPSSSSAFSSFSSFSSSSTSNSSSTTSTPAYGAGVAVSWGAGHFGQLGHGTDVTSCLGPRIINRLLPHNVGGRVVEIAAGGLHSAAIVVPHTMNSTNCRKVAVKHSKKNVNRNNSDTTDDGEELSEIIVRETRTFVWGSNRKGQCGIDGGKCATVPEPLPVVSVRRGEGDVTASKTTTSSDGGNDSIDHPVDRFVHFEKLSLGRLHTVALTAYGEVFAWGSTSMGRCGQGGPTTYNSGESGHGSIGTIGSSSTSDRRFFQRPRHVSVLRDVVIESIAAGGAHTLALSRGGRVYAWGAGGDGQCGQGHAGNLFSPRLVRGLPPFSERISAFTKAPAVEHKEESWTDNNESLIPHVDSKVAMAVTLEEEALSKALSMSQIITDDSNSQNSNLESDRVVSIRASGCYSAAITAKGDIYTWGYGSGEAIGHPIPGQNNDLPYIPIIEGNQYSVATAAKVFPEGGSENNVIRDCRCFDTDLNVMLPRRVECVRSMGLHVEDAALGPGHMVVLCSLKGSENIGRQGESNQTLSNSYGTTSTMDVAAKTHKIMKGNDRVRVNDSTQASPALNEANATKSIKHLGATIEDIQSSVGRRPASSGWISKIKPSSRAGKSGLATSQSSAHVGQENEKRKSFMQILRRNNAHATASDGGDQK